MLLAGAAEVGGLRMLLELQADPQASDPNPNPKSNPNTSLARPPTLAVSPDPDHRPQACPRAGGPTDMAEARVQYALASAQGHDEAQGMLGQMNFNGQGGAEDFVEAGRQSNPHPHPHPHPSLSLA